MIPRSKASYLLIAPALILAVIALFLPRIPQPLDYHNFADHRAWLGIPNFGDVISNVPFAIIGIWGLVAIFISGAMRFADPLERWPYAAVFAGLILTAFGSAYYHLAPDNTRLVWDRIPIMMAMMALVAAVIAERVNLHAGLALLPILEVVGVASVLVWRSSELHGHGDLRFYAALQIYAILTLLLVLFIRPRYTRSFDFAVVVGFYALAKIFEESDRRIYAVGNLVSGHTLKHLAAAAAGYWIIRMLQNRRALALQ
jgi:hypothetical protein